MHGGNEPPKQGKKLVHKTKDTYGNDLQAHLLEQYRLYVEGADRISERRSNASNYLITLNSAIVAMYELLPNGRGAVSSFALPFAGILIAVTWIRLIWSYRKLNDVKFSVIHELEDHLPARPYEYEWDQAKGGASKKYLPVTQIEILIPLCFIVTYVILALHAWFPLL